MLGLGYMYLPPFHSHCTIQVRYILHLFGLLTPTPPSKYPRIPQEGQTIRCHAGILDRGRPPVQVMSGQTCNACMCVCACVFYKPWLLQIPHVICWQVVCVLSSRNNSVVIMFNYTVCAGYNGSQKVHHSILKSTTSQHKINEKHLSANPQRRRVSVVLNQHSYSRYKNSLAHNRYH